LIGGEGNGGVICPSIGFNRDALAAMAIVLSFMADAGKAISELAAEIPSYFMIKNKIECKDQEEAEALLEKIKTLFRKEKLILTDGVKAVFPSRWVHVRASNTEPVIRIIAEGKGKKEAEDLVKQVLDSLG
jgi:phosphomannomutase